jgi:glucose/arabinose dehydrogenase
LQRRALSARPTRVLLGAFCSVVLGAGCLPAGGGNLPPADRAESGTLATASPRTASDGISTQPPMRPRLKEVRVRLVRIARVRDAVALEVAPGDSRLFVASRRGGVFALGDSGEPEMILNLAAEARCCIGQSGLLGLTFSPNGTRAYVSFVGEERILIVAEFEFRDGRIVRRTRRDILAVPQSSVQHHGGHLTFGPDGYLWIGTGDGSEGFDPTDAAQSLDSLLGKLLRVDPRASGRRPYGIPRDNPFVDRRQARPEIYAYGLRNPWRFSFDQATGDLWIGDVGQYVMEEVDFLPEGRGAGANFGWNRMEGSRYLQGQKPKRLLPPIAEYEHDGKRCAVIGGFVYRGTAIARLHGAYVYGDWCDGTVRALVQRGGLVVQNRSLGARIKGLASFGVDADGELYVLSLFTGIYRLEPRP